MIRGVAVEFAGQSVYPTMILRSSTAPFHCHLCDRGYGVLFVCLCGHILIHRGILVSHPRKHYAQVHLYEQVYILLPMGSQ